MFDSYPAKSAATQSAADMSNPIRFKTAGSDPTGAPRPASADSLSGKDQAATPARTASSKLEALRRRVRTAPQEDTAALVREVQAALDQLRDSGGDTATEADLLGLLLHLARRSGKLPDHRTDLERAVALSTGGGEDILQFSALRCELEMQEGRYDEAEATLRSGLEKARDLGDDRKAELLLKLGQVLVHQERYSQAQQLLAGVLPALDDGGHAALAATCRFHLGNLALRAGRPRAAAGHHMQGLAVRKGLGEAQPICASLTALGAVERASGNYPRALERFTQAEREARRSGELADLAYAEYGLGKVLGRLGDHGAAAAKLRSSLDLRREIGDREGQAISQIAVAENILELGQPRPAMTEAKEAAFHLSMLSPSGIVGDGEQLLGRIHLAQRNATEARRHFQEARGLHRKHEDLVAVTFDQAWLLRVAFEWPVRETLEELVEEIASYLDNHPYPDLGERLDHVVFMALEKLAERGESRGRIADRDRYLERAYNAILHKTQHLDPELRHRFLFQVPENDSILKAAAERGLGDPGLRPN